jgi:AraC family transcriptional regulator
LEDKIGYRIEELDFEFCVMEIRQPVVTKRAFKVIPTLWREAKSNGLRQRLIDMSWENPRCKIEGLLIKVRFQHGMTAI